MFFTRHRLAPWATIGDKGVEVAKSLFAVSDLHVSSPANLRIVDEMHAESEDDWLIVAGDVGQTFDDVERVLHTLRRRYARVIWAPGNHELWTTHHDRVQLRGEARYQALVRMCRDNGILTPEDEFAVWEGSTGPLTIAPIFQLYDYSWGVPGITTKEESLEYALRSGVICADEMLLHPDPHTTRASWCEARLQETESRLSRLSTDVKTVLVSHWPLIRQPTEALRFPAFAQWCGTSRTSDWHRRFRAELVIYGHLHIPRTSRYDGVRFEEVSLGYPNEWSKRSRPPITPKKVLADA
jgi:3',5'-cyclic AMP phosphodiesterase CpdA